MSYQPSEVFVPGKYPVNATNAYANRGEKETQLGSALRINSVPIVYGGYGVGKSSMVLRVVSLNFPSLKRIYIESAEGLSPETIKVRILETLGQPIRQNLVQTNVVDQSFSIDAQIQAGKSFWSILKLLIGLKFGKKVSKSRNSRSQYADLSTDDSKIIQQCEQNTAILIIDELHKANPDLIAWIASFIKKYSNSQVHSFKICLLGTSSDPTKLVQHDPGIDRLLSEIKLESFDPDESSGLVVSGFSRLELSCPDDVKQKLVRSAVGSPYILQFIALRASEIARENGQSDIYLEYLDIALNEYAQTKAQRMIHQYKIACETVGTLRYRKQVLHAMARLEDEYVTMEQIVSGVSAALGREVPNHSLSGPLRELKTSKYGEPLRDVSYPDSHRVQNFSTFSDPAMKFIIKLIEENPDIALV